MELEEQQLPQLIEVKIIKLKELNIQLENNYYKPVETIPG
jgi:hypothetical protein